MNLYWKTKVTLSSLFLLGFAVNPVNQPIENIEEVKNSLKESNSDSKKEYIKSLYSKASFTASNFHKNQTIHLDTTTLYDSQSYNNSTTNFDNSHKDFISIRGSWEIALLLSFLFSFLFISKILVNNFNIFRKFDKNSNFWNFQKKISISNTIYKKINALLFQSYLFQQKNFTFFTQVKHYTCS